MNAFDPPIEVTTRYATSVNSMTDAWAFVMERIDKVGPDACVTITPRWIVGVGDIVDAFDGRETEGPPRQFEVVVSGMVHETRHALD